MGEIFTSLVEHISSGGAGVLNFQGKRVFMDFTAPGDLAVGRIIEDKRSWARAELLELSEASPLRASPACPLYGTCGGCSLQHLNYKTQVAEKALILQDAFKHIGGITLPPAFDFIPSPPWNYRNRMQLHCILQNRPQAKNHRAGTHSGLLATQFPAPLATQFPAQNRLGFMGRKSGDIIPVDRCPVADPGIASALQEGAILPPPAKDRFTVFSFETTLLSEGTIRGKAQSRGTVTLLGKELRMDAGVFFQSNCGMLERLIGDLAQIAGTTDRTLPMADLYCGVGTFAAFLGEQFPRIDLVEENPEAIVLARENIRGQDGRLFAQTGDLWAKGCTMDSSYGFMVADPPRQGLSPALRRALAEKGPPVLAYVSCDPGTLARDCGELLAGGYRLEMLRGYDFYPQTAHIESLAVFRKG
ncbi:23S rRNA (uracil-5-)-methyltransferase RumA [Treponema primitia ZAS-2]|uniref:23S rRNA (Uracil-5-)-methyltransferase RumA n=2 Tax=Treponema primitia TaxID=88058 RepID=F5YMT5_TREPZ|nr:23S rRNA (uracil-5-)-methyltransferase RumA [Treponema primitia ZAS-2]